MKPYLLGALGGIVAVFAVAYLWGRIGGRAWNAAERAMRAGGL